MSEADLCREFAATARGCGWRVYPETGGFDLLLVWTGDAPPSRAGDEWEIFDGDRYGTGWRHQGDVVAVEAGTQVGVEAKLRPNVDVLAQALPSSQRWNIDSDPAEPTHGPDFRAVLVPKSSQPFVAVAKALGLHVYGPSAPVVCPRQAWKRKARVVLPPVVPSWDGGHPSPRTLTEWRVGALRICALLRRQGFVTRGDFARLGVDHRRWVAMGWVRPGFRLTRKAAPEDLYEMGVESDGCLLPDRGYETERDALAEVA